MRLSIADYMRRMAYSIREGQYGNSPYLNIPYHLPRLYPSDPAQVVQDGPPSMYNEPGLSERTKNKKDIRRQGPRPTPVDWNEKYVLPVTVTNIGNPKEDVQGEPRNNTTPEGRNEDRDTIGFNPGELDHNPYKDLL